MTRPPSPFPSPRALLALLAVFALAVRLADASLPGQGTEAPPTAGGPPRGPDDSESYSQTTAVPSAQPAEPALQPSAAYVPNAQLVPSGDDAAPSSVPSAQPTPEAQPTASVYVSSAPAAAPSASLEESTSSPSTVPSSQPTTTAVEPVASPSANPTSSSSGGGGGGGDTTAVPTTQPSSFPTTFPTSSYYNYMTGGGGSVVVDGISLPCGGIAPQVCSFMPTCSQVTGNDALNACQGFGAQLCAHQDLVNGAGKGAISLLNTNVNLQNQVCPGTATGVAWTVTLCNPPSNPLLTGLVQATIRTGASQGCVLPGGKTNFALALCCVPNPLYVTPSPSSYPTNEPTLNPTLFPTPWPTEFPTPFPTHKPSTPQPQVKTRSPSTTRPTTRRPSRFPTHPPVPTVSPSALTDTPSSIYSANAPSAGSGGDVLPGRIIGADGSFPAGPQTWRALTQNTIAISEGDEVVFRWNNVSPTSLAFVPDLASWIACDTSSAVVILQTKSYGTFTFTSTGRLDHTYYFVSTTGTQCYSGYKLTVIVGPPRVPGSSSPTPFPTAPPVPVITTTTRSPTHSTRRPTSTLPPSAHVTTTTSAPTSFPTQYPTAFPQSHSPTRSTRKPTRKPTVFSPTAQPFSQYTYDQSGQVYGSNGVWHPIGENTWGTPLSTNIFDVEEGSMVVFRWSGTTTSLVAITGSPLQQNCNFASSSYRPLAGPGPNGFFLLNTAGVVPGTHLFFTSSIPGQCDSGIKVTIVVQSRQSFTSSPHATPSPHLITNPHCNKKMSLATCQTPLTHNWCTWRYAQGYCDTLRCEGFFSQANCLSRPDCHWNPKRSPMCLPNSGNNLGYYYG